MAQDSRALFTIVERENFMETPDTPQFLEKNGLKIAYRSERPLSTKTETGVLFCPGFKSDMSGTKAEVLSQHLREKGAPFTRFDYRGCGLSGGAFEDGTIGLWLEDALSILDDVCTGKQIIVGSSMGGWMALLLAKARPNRVAGLLLLAPAPDFPTELMVPAMGPEARASLDRDGVWMRPSEYEDGSYPITKALIGDAKIHTVLNKEPIPYQGPMHILHGSEDEAVPVAHGLRAADCVTSKDVITEVIKGADHRLSDPRSLALLMERVDGLLGQGT